MTGLPSPPPALLALLGAMFVVLTLGSAIRVVATRRTEEEVRRRRMASLRTWWMLAFALSVCLLAGRTGICLFMSAASFGAIREFSALIDPKRTDLAASRGVYVLLVGTYALLWLGWIEAFVTIVPVASAVAVAVIQLLQERPEGYVRSTAGLCWGSLVLIYLLSHAVLLFVLPQTSTGPAGAAGWFLYLIVLTEMNDIAQAIVGRRFGERNHRIAPRISPGKTWEGFLGGLCVTPVLAILLAPAMTTLHTLPMRMGATALPQLATPLAVGLVIGVAGYFGDINMSAVKRDAGVKDSGNVLPGMGGVIDRIDSLSFTAPAFVYFVMWVSS